MRVLPAQVVSVAVLTISVVEITAVQRRTIDDLFGRGPPTTEPPAGTAEALRTQLGERLDALGFRAEDGRSLWLGKAALGDRDRCEGLLDARLRGEAPPFEYTLRSGTGTLFHKALEVEIGTERRFDPRSVGERAAVRLAEDRRFGEFWSRLDEFDQADMLNETVRRLTLFRSSFPPLRRSWVPVSELRLRASLAGGAVTLSGQIDLVLGKTPRLAIDFKSGGAWPEYPEDMRFYALLMALRFGVPPYRVATYFLDSGDWQAEDVTEAVLQRAADRVVQTAEAAARLSGGGTPDLRPGAHCGWCPRGETCPASAQADRG